MDDKETKKDETLDLETLEKGFNQAVEELQKAMKDKVKKADAEEYEEDLENEEEIEEPEGEEEGEGEEELPVARKSVKKSIPDILYEDPEAAAAMDVEPFLLQFAKAVDERIQQVYQDVKGLQKLIKSQAKVVLESAKLQKSVQELVKSLGDVPVPTNSVVRMMKSTKFDGEKKINGLEVLAKSREWVRKGQMDLVEAGIVENRINKGLLFRVNDQIDMKVQALLKEEK